MTIDVLYCDLYITTDLGAQFKSGKGYYIIFYKYNDEFFVNKEWIDIGDVKDYQSKINDDGVKYVLIFKHKYAKQLISDNYNTYIGYSIIPDLMPMFRKFKIEEITK
jgi:hypothetical protein